jgi:hypothetical protein
VGRDILQASIRCIGQRLASVSARTMPVGTQLLWLAILAIPVASIAWTVTHEEIFREPREWCVERSKNCRQWYLRKLFYIGTCEYCFSHYVAALLLLITRFKLLYPGWRGYVIAGFSLVWLSNFYMSVFGRIRLDIKRERVELSAIEEGKEHVLPQRGD